MTKFIKGARKALLLGLPGALIIGFSLVVLYILIPMLISGGGIYLYEFNEPLLITEILLVLGTLGYGGYRIGKLIRERDISGD